MKCPSCEELLVMTERKGIEIDYCPKCRGVWLDKGELDKIIERSLQEEAPPAPPTYREERKEDYYPKYDERRDYKYGHKKKKGFLGDLFDFD
jgi:Zn-finger nucleic acid-binding protein